MYCSHHFVPQRIGTRKTRNRSVNLHETYFAPPRVTTTEFRTPANQPGRSVEIRRQTPAFLTKGFFCFAFHKANSLVLTFILLTLKME